MFAISISLAVGTPRGVLINQLFLVLYSADMLAMLAMIFDRVLTILVLSTITCSLSGRYWIIPYSVGMLNSFLYFILFLRNSTFFSLIISANLFRTKTDSGFLVLIELNKHCESVHTVILVFSNFSSFDTNLRLLIAINNVSNSSRGIYIVCLGAILDFKNSRLISVFSSSNVFK